MTLQEITTELTENHGFKQETKVQFSRGDILVRVENALRVVEGFPPYLSVKIFNHDAGKYIHLNCSIESLQFFENDQS